MKAAATPSHLGPLAASGWRDTTRVAAADPELWQQIFTSNAAAIAAALERFDSSLAELRQAVARGDTRQLVKLLQQANRNRDALGS